MLDDFLLGVLASAITGVVLWAVLPRGVTLTRSVEGVEPDAWLVRNVSAVPAQLTSVTWQGVDTVEGDKVVWRDVPVEAEHDAALRLVPNEDQLFYELTLTRRRWRGFVIPPGDDLTATVFNNRTLRIKYRRAGITGIFERRELRIHGGT
ncbi:hypothetical protein V2J52_16745 [Georgenia sp. MJ173]|uniref:hypothetical protein n=1 Tax=Georgenia sunbinii TaxID=3117728 RepID=UPI002F262927